MAFVLQFIGALVVAFFILLGLGALYLVFKLRRLKGKITEMATQIGGLAVPVSIELVPEDSPDWKNARQVEDWTTVVKSQGFMSAGDFRLAMQQGALTRGFVHANGESMAAICEFGNGQVWLDYVQFAMDDQTLTATNVDTPHIAKDPPWKTSVRIPNGSPEELYDQFCKASLANPKVFSTDDFKLQFEESFRRVMEWQYSSGNISTDHLDQLSELTGLTIDPETQKYLGYDMAAAYERRMELQAIYLERSGVLAKDWEKLHGNLAFIEVDSPRQTVIDTIEAFFDTEDLEDIAERMPTKKGTEFFWALIQTLGHADQAKVIYRIEDPATEVIQISA